MSLVKKKKLIGISGPELISFCCVTVTLNFFLLSTIWPRNSNKTSMLKNEVGEDIIDFSHIKSLIRDYFSNLFSTENPPS